MAVATFAELFESKGGMFESRAHIYARAKSCELPVRREILLDQRGGPLTPYPRVVKTESMSQQYPSLAVDACFLDIKRRSARRSEIVSST